MARTSPKPDNGNIVDNSDDVIAPVNVVGKSPDIGSAENPIDPGSLGTADEFERDEFGNVVIGASGKPRRKRGRKSGGSIGGSSASTNKNGARNNQAINQGLETLSQSLLIVHMGIAAFTDFDKFKLEKSEADSLSNSIANVMDQFDMVPDPRFTAVIGLVTCAGMIYGPRVYLYNEYKKSKRREKKTETVAAPDNVSQFRDGAANYNLGG